MAFVAERVLVAMLLMMPLMLMVCKIDAFSPRAGSIRTFTNSKVNSWDSLVLRNLNEDIDAVMTEQNSFMARRPKFGPSPDKITLGELKDKLAKTGASGLVAYGFLNCLYYTVATAIVWFTISSKEAVAAVEVGTGFMMKLRGNMARFPKIMLLVWAGSQATKVFRISGSLFITPWTSAFLDGLQKKFDISQSKAVAICSSALLSFTALFYAMLLIVATKVF